MVGVPAEVRDHLESVLAVHGLRGARAGHPGGDENRPAGLVIAVPARVSGWTAIIEDSVTAVWLILREYIPGLLESGSGSIVICCPALVQAGSDMESTVAAAVAREAIVGLVHCLANELGPNRIRVNAVARPAGQWSPSTMATIGWLLSARARQITGVCLPGYFPNRTVPLA